MRQKIKKVWFYGCWLCRFSFLMVFFLIITLPLRFNKKYKDLWLIGERPDEARDNGYWLYKWILGNKPETNVRFVLARKSVDYEKMPRKDLIIEPGSAKHYIYYILSSYSVSTHMHGVCPGKSFVIPFLPFVRHKKTVFLQHGIVKDSLNLRGCLDAIIASAEIEKNLIIKANPRYKDKVYITGLCRYDQLEDTSNEQESRFILVMPTFRRYLRDIGRLKDADKVFKQTTYYEKWNSVINNPKLASIMEQNNLELVFFPHKDMQNLAHNLKSDNRRVKIGKPGEYDTQTLLKSGSILLTDYSSVFFDFVYMDKPVIFYQFDQEDFFSKHYASSGESYPFGDIFTDEDGFVNEIEATVNRGYTMKKKYQDDTRSFYKYRDQKNCERNYNLIMGLE